MNDIAHFARFDEREALSLERRGRVVARRVVDERFELPQMLAQGIGAQKIAARLQRTRANSSGTKGEKILSTTSTLPSSTGRCAHEAT